MLLALSAHFSHTSLICNQTNGKSLCVQSEPLTLTFQNLNPNRILTRHFDDTMGSNKSTRFCRRPISCLTRLDKHGPEKVIKLKYNPNPFINREIRSLIRNKSHLHQIARTTGPLEDWNAFKSLKRRVKSVIRHAKIDYFNEEIPSSKNCRGTSSYIFRIACRRIWATSIRIGSSCVIS